MNEWTSEEMQSCLNELLRRTSVDAGFRKLALDNSVAAFAEVVPRPLPPGITFRFLDNEGPVKTFAIS